MIKKSEATKTKTCFDEKVLLLFEKTSYEYIIIYYYNTVYTLYTYAVVDKQKCIW